ncbi:hypothetical protein B296_00037910, partial [Ensete ventricosum]
FRWCLSVILFVSFFSTLRFQSTSLQCQVTTMDKGGYVVLDIDNLTQPPEKCYTGSPKMTVYLLALKISDDLQKALSRKGSNRMEKRTSDEQEADDETKKLVVKGMCCVMRRDGDSNIFHSLHQTKKWISTQSLDSLGKVQLTCILLSGSVAEETYHM